MSSWASDSFLQPSVPSNNRRRRLRPQDQLHVRIRLLHGPLISLPPAHALNITQYARVPIQPIRRPVPHRRQRKHEHDVGRRKLLARKPLVTPQALVQLAQRGLESALAQRDKPVIVSHVGRPRHHDPAHGRLEGPVGPVPPVDEVCVRRVGGLDEELAVGELAADVFHAGAAFCERHVAVLDDGRGALRMEGLVLVRRERGRPLVELEGVLDA